MRFFLQVVYCMLISFFWPHASGPAQNPDNRDSDLW